MQGLSELRPDSVSVAVQTKENRADMSTRWLGIFPVALGIALLVTNRWFTEVDDEVAIVDQAARPLRLTVGRFLNGVGMHEHPPLYDLLLHGWLRLTGGNIHLLRVPAILFFTAGAWALSVAARRLGGNSSQVWTLVLVSLFPLGFHFGRLATWYSCGFLLVSLLTLTYLRFVEHASGKDWMVFAGVSLALVYTNYFGWAFLAMIALDYTLRNRRNLRRASAWLGITAGVLLLAYLPIFRAFEHEVHAGRRSGVSALGIVFGVGYNLYLIFVSESVAVWFWPLSIAALAAIGVCVFLLLRFSSPARPYFLYFAGLIPLLAALGILVTKRTFFATPWLLLPLGVALGTMSQRLARSVLFGSLVVCGAIGWYGILARNLYAAPHWIEPWETVARRSATTVANGGMVIGNNPSFFFYLTYLLPQSPIAPYAGRFPGLLPDSVRTANVYTPQQWMAAGRPVRPVVMLVKGVHYGTPAAPTDETQKWLDDHCHTDNVERSVRDSGADFKKTYVSFSQPEWRVEVRNYSCR